MTSWRTSTSVTTRGMFLQDYYHYYYYCTKMWFYWAQFQFSDACKKTCTSCPPRWWYRGPSPPFPCLCPCPFPILPPFFSFFLFPLFLSQFLCTISLFFSHHEKSGRCCYLVTCKTVHRQFFCLLTALLPGAP